MTISAEVFKKDPDKYLKEAERGAVAVDTVHGSRVILTAEEYEELDTLRCIEQGLADVKAGRVHTHEEVFGRLEKKAEDLKKKYGI